MPDLVMRPWAIGYTGDGRMVTLLSDSVRGPRASRFEPDDDRGSVPPSSVTWVALTPPFTSKASAMMWAEDFGYPMISPGLYPFPSGGEW